MKKKVLAVLLVLAMVFALAACGGSDSGNGGGDASAESSYPEEVITMLVNYSAGGGTDLCARALADAAAKVLGGTITVSNVEGGSGTVGVAQLATEKNDGYVIGVATLAPLAVVPFTMEVPYTTDDFEYICAFGQYGYGIVVSKDSPYQTLDDLLEAGKQGTIKFGATGYPQPFAMDELGEVTGGSYEFVAYTSTADMVTDVMADRIPFAVADMASFASYVKSGDIRLLASACSQRWAVAPEVETLKEMGYDVELNSFLGLAAPKGVDEATLTILRDAFKTACEDETYKETLANANILYAYMTGDEYAQMVKDTYAENEKNFANVN